MSQEPAQPPQEGPQEPAKGPGEPDKAPAPSQPQTPPPAATSAQIGPHKKHPGPPEHEPTPETRGQVETMAGLGFNEEEIALVISSALQKAGKPGISETTLKRHYAFELRFGVLKTDVAVAQSLYKKATGSGPQSVSAAIYWMKVRRRWHEVQRVIHGFDPEVLQSFVRQVVSVLRRKLPDRCPHCKTNLEMPRAVGAELIEMSKKLFLTLPPSEIVAKPFEDPPPDASPSEREAPPVAG